MRVLRWTPSRYLTKFINTCYPVMNLEVWLLVLSRSA